MEERLLSCGREVHTSHTSREAIRPESPSPCEECLDGTHGEVEVMGTVREGDESVAPVEPGGAVVFRMHQHGLHRQGLAGLPGPLQAVEEKEASQALSLLLDRNREPGDERNLNRISRQALPQLIRTVLEGD